MGYHHDLGPASKFKANNTISGAPTMNWAMFFPFLKTATIARRKIIGATLTLIGIILWLYVIASFRVWTVHPDNIYGLYEVVPIWFWIGIFSLLSGMIIMIDCAPRYFFLFQLILLNFMVWITPVFIEPNARVTDTWVHFSNTQMILETASIPSRNYNTYLAWPGSFVYHASFILLSGISPMTYMKYFPILSSAVFLFGYYLLVKHLVKGKQLFRIALIYSVLLNVWLQFHCSPQAVGLMLFPLVLFTILFKRTWRWFLVLTILLGVLLITHPTTSLFLFAIIISIFTLQFILKFKDKTKRKLSNQQIFILMLVVSTTVVVGYMFFGYGGSSLITRESISQLPDSIVKILKRRMTDPASTIRLVTFGLYLVFSVLGLYLIRKSRKSFSILFGWIAGAILAFLADLSTSGAHFHNRALFYLYFVLPLIFFIFLYKVKTPKWIKQGLVVGMLLLSILCVSTTYYIENEAIISDSNISTSVFVINKTTTTPVSGEQSVPVILGIEPQRLRPLHPPDNETEGTLVIFDDYSLQSKIVGPHVQKYYEKYTNPLEKVNLVYSSGPFRVYSSRYVL
jgi:hypothetical protein